MRYYIHVEDHHSTLDDTGVEFPTLADARLEALRAAGELLRNGAGTSVWDGKPFRMWCTDQPNGKGRTLFSLYFAALDEGQQLEQPVPEALPAAPETPANNH